MTKMTDKERKAAHAAAMRRYRLAHPDKVLAQRLRDANALLTRHGYRVTPPGHDADGLTASDTAAAKAGEADAR